MANIKSQIKRIKTNEKAQARNKSARSGLKTAIRRFKDAVAAGDSKKIQEELVVASKSLDAAVSRGVLHLNAAANKKSALAKQANLSNKSSAATK